MQNAELLVATTNANETINAVETASVEPLEINIKQELNFEFDDCDDINLEKFDFVL